MSFNGSLARYMFVVFHQRGSPRNITAQNAKMTFLRVVIWAADAGGGDIVNKEPELRARGDDEGDEQI